MEVHAIDASHQCRRQEYHGGNGKGLDDLVLFNIDKALGGIHKEIHLLEQEIRVCHQRVEVAQHLAQRIHFDGMLADVPYQE
ncbi:hypothetical protein D3C83_54620 [compost metagenome]